mmetsp:Transcript_2400/g.2346  ORF Transcript_2400/g.2346 Transcript_2400/m.2346 type:complete len:110 (-) Transcript_2400:70-399(-)
MCFDKLQSLEEMSRKVHVPKFEQYFSITAGKLPHRKKIYQDRKGETISYFSSFYHFHIVPNLHQNSLKLRNGGKEGYETAIIASQLFQNKLISLHSDGSLREYNLKTGK